MAVSLKDRAFVQRCCKHCSSQEAVYTPKGACRTRRAVRRRERQQVARDLKKGQL